MIERTQPKTEREGIRIRFQARYISTNEKTNMTVRVKQWYVGRFRERGGKARARKKTGKSSGKVFELAEKGSEGQSQDTPKLDAYIGG